MSQAPDDRLAGQLDVLRSGVRIMALRALGDADLADDVAQETVARVLAAIEDGRVQQPESLGGFAHGVARHVLSDVIRERERQLSMDALDPASRDPPMVGCDPLEMLVRLETENGLRAALRQLSDRDRDLLRLSYFDGLKPAQIAERMGVAVTRIRMRKSRALERLRRAFREVVSARYKATPASTKHQGQKPPAAPSSRGAEKQ